jgi:hypothetical protein
MVNPLYLEFVNPIASIVVLEDSNPQISNVRFLVSSLLVVGFVIPHGQLQELPVLAETSPTLVGTRSGSTEKRPVMRLRFIGNHQWTVLNVLLATVFQAAEMVLWMKASERNVMPA